MTYQSSRSAELLTEYPLLSMDYAMELVHIGCQAGLNTSPDGRLIPSSLRANPWVHFPFNDPELVSSVYTELDPDNRSVYVDPALKLVSAIESAANLQIYTDQSIYLDARAKIGAGWIRGMFVPGLGLDDSGRCSASDEAAAIERLQAEYYQRTPDSLQRVDETIACLGMFVLARPDVFVEVRSRLPQNVNYSAIPDVQEGIVRGKAAIKRITSIRGKSSPLQAELLRTEIQ